MAIDWSQLGQNLSQLPANPLFDLGLGLMANGGAMPYGTTMGQRLVGALGDMGSMQANIAAQRAAQLQAQQQQAMDDQKGQLTQAQIALAQGKLKALNAPAQPTYDKTLHGFIDPTTHQLIPITLQGAPGQPNFVAPTPRSPMAQLPQETQAYVPKVLAALGDAPPTNPDGSASDALVGAVGHVEDASGNPRAVSRAGAIGPMQLMPATATSVGVTDPFNAAQNVAGGTKYLNQLLQRYHGNVQMALAAYNAGPGRVDAAFAGASPAPAQAPQRPLAQYEAQFGSAKPGVIQQRAQQWQQLVQAGAVDPTNTQARNQYLVTGKDSDAGFNANQPQVLGDPKLNGAQYMASIDPTDRATVLAAMQGRMRPPSGTASKSSYWMGVMNAVRKVDPTFDETTWESRYKTAQAYSPGGTFGQQANALNTLINHANGWMNSVSGLHNGASPMFNSLANSVAYNTGLGAQSLPAVKTNSQALADEIESLWKKGGGSEEQIKQYASALSPNMSPTAARATISKVLELATGKLNSMQKQYKNAMGSGAQSLQFVNPQSQKIVTALDPDLAKTIGADATAPAAGAIANPAAAGNSGVPPVGVVEGGYRFKGGDPSQQSSWERVQ